MYVRYVKIAHGCIQKNCRRKYLALGIILDLTLERSTIWGGWSDEESTDESGYPRTMVKIERICVLLPESGGKFYKVIWYAHKKCNCQE